MEEEKQVGEVVEQVVERLEERRGPRQAIQVELEYAFKYQGCTPRLVPQGIELPRPTPQKLAKAGERDKVDFNLLCLYLLTTLTGQRYISKLFVWESAFSALRILAPVPPHGF